MQSPKLDDPFVVGSYNIRLLQQYIIGWWLWVKTWLVVPGMYVCAGYCCAVELFLDVFCTKPLKQCIDEWNQSSLLTEYPKEKRIAVMTGADGTIGTEVSRLLLDLGFEIAIFGVKRPRLSYLKDWDRLHLFKCDLLIPNQVHKAINEFQQRFKYVDLFIFNAGVMLHPKLNTKESIDPHFTINILSHALIFESLKPLMERSPRTSPKIIASSSSTCHLGDLQRFIYGDPRRAFRCYRNGYKSYCDSKLLTSLYFRYVATNVLLGTKIKVATLHPGVVPGSLYRHVFLPFKFLINNFLKFIIRDNKRAAIEILSLAFNDRIRTGYYYEHCSAKDFSCYSDPELKRIYDAVQMEIR